MEIMPDSSYAEVETEEIEQQQNGLQVYLGGKKQIKISFSTFTHFLNVLTKIPD